MLNLSSAGKFNRLTHATSEIEIVKVDRIINTGANLMPKGVKFKARPSNGTIAMLNMKLSATRSIPHKSSLLGNNIEINEYPGRKSNKGIPRISLTGVSFKDGIKIDSIHNRGKRIASAMSTFFNNFSNIYIIHKNDNNIVSWLRF